jgi:hypothetical protein
MAEAGRLLGGGQMTRYYLEITCRVHGVPREEAEEIFDRLADAVYDLTDVIDPDLGANLAEGLFDFAMAVDAPDEVSALGQGLAAVRCAIHASGGSTPGWEDHFETIQQVVRRESALTA